MKRFNKIVFLVIFLTICLCGCGKKDETAVLKEKAKEEIEYLDIKIVNLLNQINNITLENYVLTSKQITVSQENKQTTQNNESQSQNEGSSGGGSQEQSSGGGQSEGQGTNGGSQSQGQSSSGGESNNQGNKLTVTQMTPNNIISNKTENIDWEEIKNEIEIINSGWSTILLDLNKSNVESSELLEFSNILNDTIIAIKDENKQQSLYNLARLYQKIPQFSNGITSNNTKNIKQTKSHILNAYVLTEQNDWEGILTNIEKAEEEFKRVMENIKENQNNQYAINKTYILLNECKNSIEKQDKQLFLLKYKDLIGSINTI